MKLENIRKDKIKGEKKFATAVCITQEQKQFMDKYNISLPKLVSEAIKELMKQSGKTHSKVGRPKQK